MSPQEWSAGDVVAYFHDDGSKATTSPVVAIEVGEVLLADGMSFPAGAHRLTGNRTPLSFYDVVITTPDDPAFLAALARTQALAAERRLERAVNLWKGRRSQDGAAEILARAQELVAANDRALAAQSQAA